MYKRKNLQIINYGKRMYGVDYVTPSVGRTIKIFGKKYDAKKYLNKISR
jgi:hypothetical protein